MQVLLFSSSILWCNLDSYTGTTVSENRAGFILDILEDRYLEDGASMLVVERNLFRIFPVEVDITLLDM
jgi:hypothetical protein